MFKKLILSCIFVLFLNENSQASISTQVPLLTNKNRIIVIAKIIDLFPYYGYREMKINGLPVPPDIDNSYSRIIYLKPGRNFIRFVVTESNKKYKKTKKVIYNKKYKKIDIIKVKKKETKFYKFYKSQFIIPKYSISFSKIDIYKEVLQSRNQYEDMSDVKNLSYFVNFIHNF